MIGIMDVDHFSGKGVAGGSGGVRLATLLTLLAGLAPALRADGFEPARRFPDTSDTIRVFVDQLPSNLTRAQRHFVATRYVGTQKLLAIQIDSLRAYNPNFIMLHYRLGTRQADSSITHIHNNRWATDWFEIDGHEDWFVHTKDPKPKRVYQVVEHSREDVREYIMDISGRINGNTTFGWKEYWVKTVLAEAAACGADAVFADGVMPPYSIPRELYNSPLGAPPYRSYIPHLEEFLDYAYEQLDRANVYFIPNVGDMVTTWDTTQGYYEDVHGIMVEGFGHRRNTPDWRQQQNRTLQALRNGKIYIGQKGVRANKTQDRLWYVSNFLLLKHDRSYINLFVQAAGLPGQMHWWPEYDLKLGPPVNRAVPENVDRMRHGSGVYFRQYRRGLVLVNPNNSERTVRLAGEQKYQTVTPWGGGVIDRRGHPPEGGLNLKPTDKEITLGPWCGAILLKATATTGR